MNFKEWWDKKLEDPIFSDIEAIRRVCLEAWYEGQIQISKAFPQEIPECECTSNGESPFAGCPIHGTHYWG